MVAACTSQQTCPSIIVCFFQKGGHGRPHLRKPDGNFVSRLQQAKTKSQVATDESQDVGLANATIFRRVESRNAFHKKNVSASVAPEESLLMDILIQQHEGLVDKDSTTLGKSTIFAQLGIGSSSLMPAMIAAWPSEKLSVLSYLGRRLTSKVRQSLCTFFSMFRGSCQSIIGPC